MANTLYDILELSSQASAETIAANFKRLHAAHGALAASGDEDATNRMIALKEAYLTLSDPVRRQKYDEGLKVRMAMVDASPSDSRGSFKWILLIIALGIMGFASQRHFAAQERTRLAAEQTAAALRLAEIEAQREKDERAAAHQEEQRRRQAEATERFERERAMDYGKQVSRDLERSEDRERQQRTQAERQRQIEAERQLARDKAYLRKLEADNRRRTY